MLFSTPSFLTSLSSMNNLPFSGSERCWYSNDMWWAAICWKIDELLALALFASWSLPKWVETWWTLDGWRTLDGWMNFWWTKFPASLYSLFFSCVQWLPLCAGQIDFLQELNDFTQTGKAQRMVNLVVLMSSGRVSWNFQLVCLASFQLGFVLPLW